MFGSYHQQHLSVAFPHDCTNLTLIFILFLFVLISFCCPFFLFSVPYRLLFGTSQLFVFQNPLEGVDDGREETIVSFELAQEEIAFKQAGFASLFDNSGSPGGYSSNNTSANNNNNVDNSLEQALLNRQLLELIPAVEEANAISVELEKMVSFEILLVAPIFLGRVGRKPEVS